MAAPQEILHLVARFEQQLDAYKSGQYNETQVRREFLDPFFKALGWDIDNNDGNAEAYKDVVHEDQIRIAGATKAPDYCFRIGGMRKYFLEAKKPSVAIKDEPAPAFQLRRYAWSAKLPLSILSDFEELAVYDGRVKPGKNDSASTARIFYCTFRDYAEKWDWIHERFSRDAVLKGAFDKFAETTKTKRGTSEVDAAFLAEIEGWRSELAKNLALRNTKLTQRELNFAVQRIIDRIIFLRICEDRGIEDYGRLQALVNGDRIYPRLVKLFEQADDRYNSGLFHFKKEPGRHEAPDELTLDLDIDDKLLRDILRGLYYPDSPYEFSVLSADILGQVYEQFLGKVIRLTDGHQAKVDDKPEVKKAGGVYYTPTYIVDCIVRQTVEKLVEGKTPKQVEKITVLDPACGSGSFLIGAYQFLLDWHLQFYLANNPEKFAKGGRPALVQTGRGWKLTIAERKRILVAHIYGVDIDAQAVEVTKLSLLLKVLEGETGQALQTILKLFSERALPDLGDNIKCGNSLIGPDFYQQGELALLTDDEKYRINVFDWRAEFPQIFRHAASGELRDAVGELDYTAPGVPLHGSFSYKKRTGKQVVPPPLVEPEWEGGFDAVIGNPPYIDSEWMTKFLPVERAYCSTKYKSASGNWDIFCVFVERALQMARRDGLVSLIVPNKLGSASYAHKTREVLAVENSLLSVRDFSHVRVFPVAVYPIVFLSKKTATKKNRCVIYDRMAENDKKITCSAHHELDYERYFLHPETPWQIFSIISENDISGRMSKNFPKLETLASVLGAATVSEAYEIANLISDGSSGLKLINSGTIDRFSTLWGLRECRYLGKKFLKPVVKASAAVQLPARRREQAETQKIVIAGMTLRLECALDMAGEILAGKSTSIVFSTIDLRYLLGILNSCAVNYYYNSVFGGNKLQGGYLRVGPPQLSQIPIPVCNTKTAQGKVAHDRMVRLVEQMLELHKKLAVTRTPQEKTAQERQIAATDTQIDRLVYDLYGLTEDEIKIVEGKVGD